MARQRTRTAQGRAARTVTPEDRKRWNRAYKFSRLGITEEKFLRMLEDQDYACAMCFGKFGEKDRIFRCNTTLGYIELYGQLARQYLIRVQQAKEDEWVALLGLVDRAGFEPATSSV